METLKDLNELIVGYDHKNEEGEVPAVSIKEIKSSYIADIKQLRKPMGFGAVLICLKCNKIIKGEELAKCECREPLWIDRYDALVIAKFIKFKNNITEEMLE